MSAGYWPEFIFVASAHLLAVASPGPDFALVLRQSISHGRRTAIITSLGIGAGILVHVSYSLLGIGMLIRSSELWFNIVRYAGAAYLVWLGIGALRTRSHTAEEASSASAVPPAASGAFTTGFIVNALNPKVALFFIGLFLTAISPQTPKVLQTLYGAWMAVATAGWFSLVSVVFTRGEVRAQFLRIGHWFDRVMGVLLIALAVRLALASFK